jgi:hypothetical protein
MDRGKERSCFARSIFSDRLDARNDLLLQSLFAVKESPVDNLR